MSLYSTQHALNAMVLCHEANFELMLKLFDIVVLFATLLQLGIQALKRLLSMLAIHS